MWLVINVNVNVVVSEVEQLYAIPDDYQWTNGGADVAAAVAVDANNDIDNDQPMMIIYDEEFDVTEGDYDGSSTATATATTSPTMATMPASVAGHFTSTWAVHIPGGDAEAESVAAQHGFSNLGKVSCWSDFIISLKELLIRIEIDSRTVRLPYFAIIFQDCGKYSENLMSIRW